MLLNLLHFWRENFLLLFRWRTVERSVETNHLGLGSMITSIYVLIRSDLANPLEIICKGERVLNKHSSFLVQGAKKNESLLYYTKVVGDSFISLLFPLPEYL